MAVRAPGMAPNTFALVTSVSSAMRAPRTYFFDPSRSVTRSVPCIDAMQSATAVSDPWQVGRRTLHVRSWASTTWMTGRTWKSTFGGVAREGDGSCEQATPAHRTAMSRTRFTRREGYGLSEGSPTGILIRKIEGALGTRALGVTSA